MTSANGVPPNWPLTSHAWLEFLNEEAIHAYGTGTGASSTVGLRRLGAALNLHGIAMNGGLVGGGVENLFFTDGLEAVTDAAEGFRWLDMPDVADLIDQACTSYQRFRPTGHEDLNNADEQLWDELDAHFFEIATDDRLEAAIRARLPEILPQHPLS